MEAQRGHEKQQEKALLAIRRRERERGELARPHRKVDDLFRGFFADWKWPSWGGSQWPVMDIGEEDDTYIIKAEVPGCKGDDNELKGLPVILKPREKTSVIIRRASCEGIRWRSEHGPTNRVRVTVRSGLRANLIPSEAMTEMAPVRIDKVWAIRRQLADHTYDVDRYLDVILEGLLAVIEGQAKEAGGELAAQEGTIEWITKSQGARGRRAVPSTMVVYARNHSGRINPDHDSRGRLILQDKEKL